MKPNVVVVITHDTGRHLGVYDRGVETPHLNRLAAEGIVFDRAFCAAPQCSPSRASMLTGLTPQRHGLIGLTHRGFRLRDEAHGRTLPALLRETGYRTHLFGFQHEAPDPRDLGYDAVVQASGRRQYCAEVAPLAADFLASPHEGPFFAMVGFFETHRPFDPTDGPLDGVRVPIYLPDDPDVRRDVADLNEQVRRVDAAVGQILDALDRSGRAAATLVVYTTDHGIAFPGAKSTLFDPGIEIALIARGPGGFAGGRRTDALASNVDVLPTILDVCGVAPPSDLDGRSLAPFVRGETAPERAHVWLEQTYHAAYDPVRGIRTSRYKYVRSFAEGPLWVSPNVDASPTKDRLRAAGYFDRPRPREMLFDLAADPLERENLADHPAHAAALGELRDRVETRMRAVGDPLLAGDVPLPAGAHATPRDALDP